MNHFSIEKSEKKRQCQGSSVLRVACFTLLSVNNFFYRKKVVQAKNHEARTVQ